jgi:4-carboxymuconolactone decarboxylase
MLTALHRPRDLGCHVRGTLRNGCTKEEIRATLLQASIDCGLPAGLDSFRVAAGVLEEERPAD